MELQDAAQRMEALGNATRLAAYHLLVRAGPDGLAVGVVQQKLKIPASTLSHHLRRLIEVGLVSQERRGATLLCHANYPAMDSLVGFLTSECCLDANRTESDAA
ncbi:MAG: metalloregulator ArsR/SmtB family transcription factor [Pseudomonadota bacterium]